MTKTFLLENFSPPPPGTILVFDKRLIGPICNGEGPKLWLGDSTLNVLDVGQVKMDSQGVYLTAAGLITPGKNVDTTAPRKYLDPRRTFFIVLYQTPTGQFFLSKSQPPVR